MQFSSMEIGFVYFYTATILNWKKLLEPDKYKAIIVDSVKHLVDKKKIRVYGFVIMPNHIHLIWEMLAKNGREMPHASLMKHTGHLFLEDLRENYPQVLPFFVVDSSTRMHHFWQRNSLPFLLNNEKTLLQKLDYIHNNPIQEKWNLAIRPEDYRYSSAKFYINGTDEFQFLTHWQDR
ncbi:MULTISPECIES: transposase [Emticicia]|uniref:transposase n=1 Tax=Emticicia TaxID=312278 RepID=UPI001E369CBF|nr:MULTISPECIES: transposase [Emticicia]